LNPNTYEGYGELQDYFPARQQFFGTKHETQKQCEAKKIFSIASCHLYPF